MKQTAGTHKMIVIRHSERIDETDDEQKWREHVSSDPSARDKRDYINDPILTLNGRLIAKTAAETVRRYAEEVTCIYSSRLTRSVETAYQLALLLDVPIYVSKGLALTALAVENKGVEHFEFATMLELREQCPGVVLIECDMPPDDLPDDASLSLHYVPTSSWEQALEEIASREGKFNCWNVIHTIILCFSFLVIITHSLCVCVLVLLFLFLLFLL